MTGRRPERFELGRAGRAAPGAVPAELAPLKLVQVVVDDPAYASADGGVRLDPADAALVDSIFAKLDLTGGLDADRFAAEAARWPEQIAIVAEHTTTATSQDGLFPGTSAPLGIAAPSWSTRRPRRLPDASSSSKRVVGRYQRNGCPR